MKNIRTLIIVVLSIVFLCSAYFMLSVTQSRPTSMKLYKPATTNMEGPTGATLTMILYNDGVYTYCGTAIQHGRVFTMHDSTFRKYLLEMKHGIPEKEFTVVIKPDASASYKNTVDVLDEMIMNDIKRYTLIDLTATEQKIIDSLRKGQKI